MKPLKRHKVFEKHFKQRILPQAKLMTQFEDAIVFLDIGTHNQVY